MVTWTCPHCGRVMRALFSTWFCPGDCDRKTPEEIAAREAVSRCPKCRSQEVEPFAYMFSVGGMLRCKPCGAVWTK